MQDKTIFKQIFKDHWESFKQKHSAYDDDCYNEAVRKMLGCGSEGNGYAEYRCTSCGIGVKRVAFTCKGAFCLSCGQVYSDGVVNQVSKMLHPGISYRHVVLTVPEQLRNIFYRHRKESELYSELIRTAYQCLEDVVSTARKQKLKIGATVVIHTHGRPGNYNPHTHVIMTDGGVNASAEIWVNLGYFPYEIIHKKWQYHLLGMIKRVIGKGISELIDLLWRNYPNGFVGHVSKGEAPTNSKGLSKYLAKYVASPPIASSRIIEYTGDAVTYWYKDHKTKQKKTETVSVVVFIGRMVQHILPKGFQRIRYYGLQATKTLKKWYEAIREGIKKLGEVIQDTYQVVACKNYRKRHIDALGEDPLKCTKCGEEMELYKIWHPQYGFLYHLELTGVG